MRICDWQADEANDAHQIYPSSQHGSFYVETKTTELKRKKRQN